MLVERFFFNFNNLHHPFIFQYFPKCPCSSSSTLSAFFVSLVTLSPSKDVVEEYPDFEWHLLSCLLFHSVCYHFGELGFSKSWVDWRVEKIHEIHFSFWLPFDKIVHPFFGSHFLNLLLFSMVLRKDFVLDVPCFEKELYTHLTNPRRDKI